MDLAGMEGIAEAGRHSHKCRSDYDAYELFGTHARQVQVHICVERPAKIALNGTPVGSFDTCSYDLEALAAGYLLSEGLIPSASAIEAVAVEGGTINVTADTTDILPEGLKHTATVDMATLFGCYLALDDYNILGRSTGGTHVAAIFTTGGGVVTSAEDVHRHGCMYRAIGRAALDRYDLGHCFLMITGRATSRMITGAYRGGLAMVVCCSVPTGKAIETAEKLGITLVSITGLDSMVIYCGSDRVQGMPDEAYLC